ncbi:MAG: MMPL family transporter [Pirellulales bacterium]
MTRKTFYARYSLLILMLFCFAAPLLLQGAHRAIRSNTNKVVDWLPKSFTETTELRWFRKHFVADQFVVISWPGCTLGDDPSLPDAKPDDPRIERLAGYLVPKGKRDARDDAKLPEHTQYFQAVTTARRTLNELTSKPSEVPYDEAVRRLKGTLIGPDGRQTCVVVMLSDAAIKNFRPVLGREVPVGSLPWQREPGVIFKAFDECGIDIQTVRLGGPPIENVAIDEEGDHTLIRLASLSGLLGLGLAWWSLRSIKLTLMVFGCGILSAAAGLAFVFWTGQTTDAIMMAMPSMLYVLAISGAVHIVNYYHDAIREHGMDGAPERALGHGWKPALLCNVTTGIGLASLSVSDLEPIRKFGIYSSAGVGLMLIFLFLFLPAALTMWPVPLSRKQRREEHVAFVAGTTNGHPALEDRWTRISTAIIRHHAAVTIGCFVFIVVVGLGLTRVRTNIDLLKLFDEKVRVRRDYAWLEEHIGRLVPLEVVIEFPPERQRSAAQTVDVAEAATKLSYLERLELVSLIQQTIDKELGPAGRNLVGPSLSPVTFAPPIPAGTRDSWALARRSVTNVKLEESEAALARSGYLQVDPETGTELWRISLRAAAFENLDYGSFVSSVRAVIDPVLAAQRVREQVLQELAASRGEGSFAGGSVCIWQRGAATDHPENAPVESPEYQQHIFSTATQQLLHRARLKLQAANVELSALSDEQRRAVLQRFQSYDCVLAIGAIPNAELRSIEEAGVRIIDARRELLPPGEEPMLAVGTPISAVYTGVVPIVYKAQRALLDNLIQSSFWSFVTITPLMMMVCRGILPGAVVMLPNVLPVLVVFGGMGWLGVPVDIGSMMAASIALGVAVDDTIHYLTWYREALNNLGDRHKAIIHAYRRCAPPTLQAALISGLGLAVFAFSSFTPTQRMGWLMMTILIAGVAAELIMMPAILAGPLGRVFKASRQESAATVPTPHAPKRKAHLMPSSQT